LGLGLSGAKRLVNEFEIDTEPGRGTTVTVIAWATGVPTARVGLS
ncbi:anti-sigma regulatory factor, partial [Streptomyces sp. NPDC049099]